MPNEKLVASNYTHGGLVGAIRDALARHGKNIVDVTPQDTADNGSIRLGD